MIFDKDTWQTPQYIFNWLHSQFDFDIDLAASDDHHYCGMYFTKDYSALDADWWNNGQIGFCNPPYSKIDPWIDKAVIESRRGFTTVMLIPMCNGEKRWWEIYEEASEIIHIVGRIGFIHPITGEAVSGNSKGSCVVVFDGDPPFTPNLDYIDRDELIENYG